MVRTSFLRRFISEAVSNNEAAATKDRKTLHLVQEKVLLGHISALGNPWYTSDACIGKKLRGGDPWELPRKELDYLTHMMSLSTFEANLPKKAEYSPYFKLFHKLVRI